MVAGSVVLTGAGVAAASLVKSPAQAAADTRPPPTSVLTATVQKKVLSETVITRGTVAAAQRIDVSGEGAGGKDAGRSIVTKVAVEAGKPLRMGQLLLEISGRPVFALEGEVPAYRDLRPGSTGDDVAQLQRALGRLGYGTGGDPSGTFGSGTERAVGLFYRAHGFAPVTEQGEPVAAPKEETTEVPEATETPRATEGVADTGGVSDGTPPATPARPVAHTVVPLSEIAYVRAEPAYVEQVSAHVGDEASAGLLTISAGKLVVDGSLSADVKGLVKPGQQVSITSEVTGDRATGTVVSVADKPSKPQKDAESAVRSGADTYAVKIEPADRLPASLAGEDVRLTITAASSGKAVLAVPASALSAGEDGRTTVTVRRGERERRVVVDTGMTADGYVQVTAVERDALGVGDRVVVGVDLSGGGPS